ncbi:MAG: thioredoxin domain-containing protein [Candidatus Dormibacteraeota bacterium]|nr:thioredoxin domain-containing protein [Candidatus Dormibacteraeota bacterium]MBV9525516.1 thioredoxin domain-containing protein [Candidatus Dormibacteraeota bacterium]
MSNRLARETSPYLRQHADNPVDWYPWGDEALSRARAEDRPLLLSVGYSACHWCHVMAHESFEDPGTAALMNEHFVNVKVDREERPDVDAVYMQAVQAMTGRGGWPMTVFLTPDGVPYYGGTYYPPVDRMGMPAFPRVLRAAAEAFRTRRSDIAAAAERMREALAAPRMPAAQEPTREQLDAAARALAVQTDMRDGGFGAAPKFPHPMALDLMLRRHRLNHDRSLWDAAVITLDAMARGGLRDQLGGGFHRYSVDGQWAVPHFEKMLYDNAQLAVPYLHAHQLSGRADFLEVCTSTLDYMTRELQLPGGGFAASQDADSPGGEGAYFVWNPEQLREALGDDDAALAARVFGVSPAGNFDHGATVLSLPYPLERVAESMRCPVDDLRTRLGPIRERLLAVRAERAAPARDDKVITSWNALALKAFAEAGAALRRDDYAATARHTADFLLEAVVADGDVMRTWKDGVAHITGFLEDSAHLADALLTVYECSGETRFFAAALDLCEQVVARYRDADGSYYDTAATAQPLIVRPRTIEDNPVTSGQAAAASAFLRMHKFTMDPRWRQHALEIIGPLAAAVPRVPVALSGLAAAMELAVEPVREVAVIGDDNAAATREMADVILRRFDPLRVLAWGRPDGVPLLAGRPGVAGRATAYVCRDFVCDAPVGDAAALEAVLGQN